MADSSKIEDISMVTVSAKVLGELIGVGDRQIRNLAEEGILVRNSHGKYILTRSIKNYITNLKIAKAGQNVASDFDDGILDLNTEKAKNEHYKAMISEIRVQLMKNEVHKSQDVGAVITDMFTKFRSKMMAMPPSLAPKLEHKKKEEIQELLGEKVNEALNELADYNPADYYADEYVELSEDEFGDEENTDEEE